MYNGMFFLRVSRSILMASLLEKPLIEIGSSDHDSTRLAPQGQNFTYSKNEVI